MKGFLFLYPFIREKRCSGCREKNVRRQKMYCEKVNEKRRNNKMYQKKCKLFQTGIGVLILLLGLCFTILFQIQTVNAKESETLEIQPSKVSVSIEEKEKTVDLEEILPEEEKRTILTAGLHEELLTKSQNVTLTVGKKVNYGGWSTNYFYINGQLSYCLEPIKSTPGNGGHIAELWNNQALTKCLYYLPGGPGWSQEVRDAIFPPIFNDDTCYAISHIIVSYAYNPNQDAFHGVGQDTMEGAIDIYNALLRNYPDPPNGSLSITPSHRDARIWTEVDPNKQLTDQFTISGDSRNEIKLYLPEGVKLHNWTKNQEIAGNNQLVSVWGNDTFQFSADSSKVNGLMEWNDIKGSIDGRYTALVIEGGGDQDVGGLTYTKDQVTPINFSVRWLSQGSCQVKKQSANPEITQGNTCYSLKGAEYGIYKEKSCSTLVDKMTTNEAGESDVVTLSAGTYFVKEIKAPKGFALDKKVYEIQVQTGSTYVLKVTDRPTMDPVGVLLGKIDKETNQNKPQGSASLEGALFEVKFYSGTPSNSDPGATGKKPERTWIFRTDKDGFVDYHNDFLHSGDELYMSPSGDAMLPIGTLTIQEKQAPQGYLLNPELYVVPITSSNDGSEFVYTYNAPKIPEQIIKLKIIKKEQGKDILIEGATFEMAYPDGSKKTFQTDAKGVCEIKGLMFGKHTIRETAAPAGYVVNPGKVTFTVKQDGTIVLDQNTATGDSIEFQAQKGYAELIVEDARSPFVLKLTKVNEKGTYLEGAEFALYQDKNCQTEVGRATTGKDGTAKFSELLLDQKYYLKEVKAPKGYRLPLTADGKAVIYEIYLTYQGKQLEYHVNGQVHTETTGDFAITGTPNQIETNLKVINHTSVVLPETGTPLTAAISGTGILCMLGAIGAERKGKRHHEKEKL